MIPDATNQQKFTEKKTLLQHNKFKIIEYVLQTNQISCSYKSTLNSCRIHVFKEIASQVTTSTVYTEYVIYPPRPNTR